MFAILHALGMFFADRFKSRWQLEAENLFLRHQLSIALRLCAASSSTVLGRPGTAHMDHADLAGPCSAWPKWFSRRQFFGGVARASKLSGAKALALGRTADELFGLHEVPAQSRPSYSRLSRYDATGLIWLLRGQTVMALAENTAAIQNSDTGNTCPFRKSYPDVLMMQSCQDWNGDNGTGPLDCSMQRRIFL